MEEEKSLNMNEFVIIPSVQSIPETQPTDSENCIIRQSTKDLLSTKNLMPDAYIEGIKVKGARKHLSKGFHVYDLEILGKTRFWPPHKNMAKYNYSPRYSTLLALHEQLSRDLELEVKTKGPFPLFPGKKFLSFKTEKFFERRVVELQKYFNILFERFRSSVRYSITLNTFFSPKCLCMEIIACESISSRVGMKFTDALISEVTNRPYVNYTMYTTPKKSHSDPSSLHEIDGGRGEEFKGEARYPEMMEHYLMHNVSPTGVPRGRQAIRVPPGLEDKYLCQRKGKELSCTKNKSGCSKSIPPFDTIYNNKMYRIQLQLTSVEDTRMTTNFQEWLKKRCMLILLYDPEVPRSYEKLRKIIQNMKLFKLEEADPRKSPCFIILGYHTDQYISQITKEFPNRNCATILDPQSSNQEEIEIESKSKLPMVDRTFSLFPANQNKFITDSMVKIDLLNLFGENNYYYSGQLNSADDNLEQVAIHNLLATYYEIRAKKL